MPFVDDLIQHARALVAPTAAGRPKQIVLRRGVSAAYYALFHEIVDQAVANILFGERSSPAIVARLRRTVTHKAAKTAAGWISQGKPPDAIKAMLGAPAPDPNLVATCRSFITMQEARHRADYDLASPFLLADAQRLVADAQAAIDALRTIGKSDPRRVFLLGCVLGDRLTNNSRR